MQNLFKVPIINIRPLIEHGPDLTKKSVIDCVYSIHIACRDIGFLGLNGHNISYDLRQETLKLSREFFSLPIEEKNKIAISNPSNNNCTGYQNYGSNVTQNQRDKHEGIDLYKYTQNINHYPFNVNKTPYPMKPASFGDTFSEYSNECLKFGELMMSGIALGLRLPYNYFQDKFNESFHILRILHYPYPNDDNADHNNDNEHTDYGVGCGEHTDYGALTLINADNTTDCLEIKDTNNIYRKVNYNTMDNDCFIVNIGDMLHLFSGGLYQSTPHRVLQPLKQNICKDSIEFNKQNNSNIGRISIPFFYEPNWDTMVESIEFDMNKDNILPWEMEDKLKWEQLKSFRANSQSIMYGDHLKSKVLSNFY